MDLYRGYARGDAEDTPVEIASTGNTRLELEMQIELLFVGGTEGVAAVLAA